MLLHLGTLFGLHSHATKVFLCHCGTCSVVVYCEGSVLGENCDVAVQVSCCLLGTHRNKNNNNSKIQCIKNLCSVWEQYGAITSSWLWRPLKHPFWLGRHTTAYICVNADCF